MGQFGMSATAMFRRIAGGELDAIDGKHVATN